MRLVALVACLALGSAAASGQSPTPEIRDRLQAAAKTHLAPCPALTANVCETARELFVVTYEEARMGSDLHSLRVADLLATGPSPPIRRNPVEACAFTIFGSIMGLALGHPSSPQDEVRRGRLCRTLPPAQRDAALMRSETMTTEMARDLRESRAVRR